MRRLVVLLVLALCVPALAGLTQRSKGAVACGVELWPMKTLSDPQRGLVRLRPKPTTIRAINRRPMPHPTPRRRTSFARQVWRVRAQIVEYKLEEDGDIHLVLFDDGAYLIAEMPAPGCLGRRTRARAAIVRARRSFEQRCGRARASWRDLGAVASISGVGFWDFPHGQHGHARNYAELHPVTALRLIVGCRSSPPPPPLPPPPPPPPPTTTTTTTNATTTTPTPTTTPTTSTTTTTTTTTTPCAPSYPDVCIPPPPPDLNCSDIPYRSFRVIYTVPDPDPHHFDGDHDGIGCES